MNFNTLNIFKRTSEFFNLKKCKETIIIEKRDPEYIVRVYSDPVSDGFVSRIGYDKVTGQIGSLIVDHKYVNRGLGKQMLVNSLEEITSSEIWLVSCEEHPFYNNVFGGAFRYRTPIVPWLSSGGFYATKKDIVNALLKDKLYRYYQTLV